MTNTPAKMTILQFMLCSVGCFAGGKQIITKLSIRNKSDKILINSPYLPREKWHFKSGRPLMRSRAIEPMEIM